MLKDLEILVYKAGQEVLSFYFQDFSAEKDKDFPVTQADLAAEKILLSGLKRYSDYGILSEEHKEDQSRLKYNKIFSIDPLDGTKDFIHQTGDFSVMLAIIENAYPVAGFIYQPLEDKLYYAIKGQGAFRKDKQGIKKIKVALENNFEDQKIAVSRYHLALAEKKLAQDLKLKDFITKGSAGLKGGLIAEGKAHIYINTSSHTGEWDIAPATILIEEAGGKVSDLDGQKLKFNKEKPFNLNGFVVSNNQNHDEIIKTLGSYKK